MLPPRVVEERKTLEDGCLAEGGSFQAFPCPGCRGPCGSTDPSQKGDARRPRYAPIIVMLKDVNCPYSIHLMAPVGVPVPCCPSVPPTKTKTQGPGCRPAAVPDSCLTAFTLQSDGSDLNRWQISATTPSLLLQMLSVPGFQTLESGPGNGDIIPLVMNQLCFCDYGIARLYQGWVAPP